MQPSVGRIVHYVSYGTPDGEYLPEHRAAIITAVPKQTVGRPWRATLCVLNPTGFFFNEGVENDEVDKVGGTYHWPERVD